jgi:hypothetical protein
MYTPGNTTHPQSAQATRAQGGGGGIDTNTLTQKQTYTTPPPLVPASGLQVTDGACSVQHPRFAVTIGTHQST